MTKPEVYSIWAKASETANKIKTIENRIRSPVIAWFPYLVKINAEDKRLFPPFEIDKKYMPAGNPKAGIFRMPLFALVITEKILLPAME